MWSNRLYKQDGTTLVEMIMVLMIISILSAIAIPHVQKQSLRQKEYQLRKDLVTMREAIDRFHKDWRDEIIITTGRGISEDGYPADLEILVEGVPLQKGGGLKRYLRQVPVNYFAKDKDEPWLFFGARDESSATRWNGVDIFDVKANADRIGVDGTKIADW